MKIVHLSVAKQLTQGQAKQLRFEQAAALMLEDVEWTTLAYHNGTATEPFMRKIPRLFQPLFMRNLYGWIIALRLSKTHDIIIMRHMTFDPFALIFAPFIRNRVSVHHAKEIDELRLIRKGWKGWAASHLERLTGRVAARNAMAILGVTREIAEYERDTHAPDKPIGVYPNGIDPAQVPLLEDARSVNSVQAAFICGTFSRWHGLDKLIAAVDAHEPTSNGSILTIHLIGHMSDEQMHDIHATEVRRHIFRAHGVMREAEYRPILAQCDVGIASLAMERQSLREGSTLKVREMLAMGVAVYSGHEDVALPQERPFVLVAENVNINSLIFFGKSTKRLQRAEIRENSLMNISKGGALVGVCRLLPNTH